MAAKLKKTRTPGIFNAHELPKTHELHKKHRSRS